MVTRTGSLEGMYRNHMKDVQRFMTRRHDGHYRVYNLTSDKYSHSKFNNK